MFYFIIFFLLSEYTVSYTHLDVYKRQSLHLTGEQALKAMVLVLITEIAWCSFNISGNKKQLLNFSLLEKQKALNL